MSTTSTFSDDDSGKPPRVLLVDDDEANLMLTATALRDRGFVVTDSDLSAAITSHVAGTKGPDVFVVLDTLAD